MAKPLRAVPVVLLALAVVACAAIAIVYGQRAAAPPKYRVDAFWPKPLPNKWAMQQIVDIYVDRDDHIWTINRRVDARPDELTAATNPPRGECCVLGPEILEFDYPFGVADRHLDQARLCKSGEILFGYPSDPRLRLKRNHPPRLPHQDACQHRLIAEMRADIDKPHARLHGLQHQRRQCRFRITEGQ
jgi:hypothetical protein